MNLQFVPAAYKLANLDADCPNCDAPAGNRCRHPDGRDRRVPCLRRIVLPPIAVPAAPAEQKGTEPMSNPRTVVTVVIAGPTPVQHRPRLREILAMHGLPASAADLTAEQLPTDLCTLGAAESRALVNHLRAAGATVRTRAEWT